MSRVGKKPIEVPDKTEVAISGDVITVKGPLGELKRTLTPEVSVALNDNTLVVSQNMETLEARALWGTYASHLSNMVRGVNTLDRKSVV